MFWGQNERENSEPTTNDDLHCGQIRVLVVGDSGVGKTSLVHLIDKGSRIRRPSPTVGCTVTVKHTSYGGSGSSSNNSRGDTERGFFVELWDVSGHERYKECRSLFYSQINGVIFVHDLAQRSTKTNLQKWASDVAATGTFSAPLRSGGPFGLLVPYIVIGNKADITAKVGVGPSNGNLVDAARQWVEKKGLIQPSEELPLVDSFPGSGGLIAAAKEARYDKEAVLKFFNLLIKRRYFADELQAPSPWSVAPSQRPPHRLDEDISNEDQYNNTPSLYSDPYIPNIVPRIPSQRNLTPSSALFPQQPPVSASEINSYNLPRFCSTGSLADSNTRLKF
ncbi:hypothetical protein MKW94_029129 [Papaver nudicaule]|uniref:Uncharacterized protein n=1 Tax=Papaver nudicaule TaxID=74823 RepID=A0AA41UYT1_PAPNU|nr:hypothetical protein [Papaver nudicaule]